MRVDSQNLESGRLEGLSIENYPWMHERHRVFPKVFENRNHKNIIDVSAGIGVTAKRIIDNYSCSLTCNEVEKLCLEQLKKLDVKTTSFDLDNEKSFPLETGSFDAVVCLATLEHIILLDHFVEELKRILSEDGRLYLTIPNYASLYWIVPFLLTGKTFHDPFGERSRYEFYAHVRYFTYQTVVDFLKHFGFSVDTVYLPLPDGSSKYQDIKNRSKVLAYFVKYFFKFWYLLSPRWHQEPVICFSKNGYSEKPKRVIL